MNFEEQFSSLEGTYTFNDPVCILIEKSKIQEHCIDKQRVENIIEGLEEEFFLIIGEDNNKKAIQIKKVILGELGL